MIRGPEVLSGKMLTKGGPVRNKDGEDLGTVEDLMIDMVENRVAYALVSTHGFLGLGKKLLAIPMEALAFNQRDSRWVLNVPKETLKKARGLDKKDLPEVADRRWIEEVYREYGYKPYWERESKGA